MSDLFDAVDPCPAGLPDESQSWLELAEAAMAGAGDPDPVAAAAGVSSVFSYAAAALDSVEDWDRFADVLDRWHELVAQVEVTAVDLVAWSFMVCDHAGLSDLGDPTVVLAVPAVAAGPFTVAVSLWNPRGLSGRFLTMSVPARLAALVCDMDREVTAVGVCMNRASWMIPPEIRVADLLDDGCSFEDVLTEAEAEDQFVREYMDGQHRDWPGPT